MFAPVKSRSEEFYELVKLAIPIAIAQGGQALMGLVDTLVVARAGTEALAAVGLANALFFGISGFGMGLMMGFDPLLSQAFGAKNSSRPRALLWQGAWMALFAGGVLGAVLWVLPSLLPLVGYQEAALGQTRAYLLWRAPSLIPMLAFLMVRSYLQSAASPWYLVIATGVANVFNLLADIYFVFGGEVLPEAFGPLLRSFPAMGVEGAALATLLCTLLQLGIILIGVRAIPFSGPPPGRWPVLVDLVQAAKVGIPIGAHIAAEIGVFALAGALAFKLGPGSMGAHQIVLSYASLSFTIALGIGSAGSVRVGWAVGARNTAQARLSGFMAFAGGAGFMALSALLFVLAPLPLARLAGAPPDVVPLVVPLLMISAVFQVPGIRASPSRPTWWGTTPSACRSRCCWASG
jgi:MATE family multidrug resistance protein